MSTRRLAKEQPDSFEFTPENLAWAKEVLARYPDDRKASAVIPFLDQAQRQNKGWVCEPAIRYIAEMLEVSEIRVYEVVTFYTQFNLKPVGETFIQVCTTTPCWLRGSEGVVKACQNRIGKGEGQVSDDGKFSYLEVECLGACVNAPMVQIGDDFYEDLTEDSMTKIIEEIDAGKTPSHGPRIDRQRSAPVGGPTTLLDASIYGDDKSGISQDAPSDRVLANLEWRHAKEGAE